MTMYKTTSLIGMQIDFKGDLAKLVCNFNNSVCAYLVSSAIDSYKRHGKPLSSGSGYFPVEGLLASAVKFLLRWPILLQLLQLPVQGPGVMVNAPFYTEGDLWPLPTFLLSISIGIFQILAVGSVVQRY
ncbi:hypothetical protein Tco_0726909 [Tanacetum coccineum]|uniref:Uncharacterized protein n=1 Tax=Tanacetum coccineum TaxID=301880 RepID=A0ABQ4YJV8_9ASTR